MVWFSFITLIWKLLYQLNHEESSLWSPVPTCWIYYCTLNSFSEYCLVLKYYQNDILWLDALHECCFLTPNGNNFIIIHYLNWSVNIGYKEGFCHCCWFYCYKYYTCSSFCRATSTMALSSWNSEANGTNDNNRENSTVWYTWDTWQPKAQRFDNDQRTRATINFQ